MKRNIFAVTATCALVGASCGKSNDSGGANRRRGETEPSVALSARVTNTRIVTANLALASIEMQITGEPFAEFLGRDLAGYDRNSPVTDQYTDPVTNVTSTDPTGYAFAVESYEYSKHAMNSLSFETGAGLSLQFGPVLNPAKKVGQPAFELLRDRFQLIAEASGSAGAMGTNLIVSPAPTDNPFNHYGWPGIWPEFIEFRSFDPHIVPSVGATRGCTLTGGYGASAGTAQLVGDFECGYSSLNLPLRDTQVERVIDVDALGYTAWKQALWVINYWQSMHDTAGNAITQVEPDDIKKIGVKGNVVVGSYPDPEDPTGTKMIKGAPGLFLGAVAMEGWQGLVMLDEIDNKAALLLGQLTTDGVSIGGFASVKDALDYDYAAPIRYWPAAFSVVEAPTASVLIESSKYFPQPTAFALAAPESRLNALSGLIGGFAETFAFADPHNAEVGGSISSRATFDGDPFAADNGIADGESSLHDRSLAVLKVSLVNLERLHFDPVDHVFVDSATVSSATVNRSRHVTTLDLAYSIVALRTAYRALTSSLVLYSNDTPDTLGAPTVLDATKFGKAPFAGPFGAHIIELIRAQADFLSTKLIDTHGAVANGFDLAEGSADDAPSLLEAEAGAIRGLLEAYLATSDEKYRARAADVYADIEARFWMGDARIYRTKADESDTMTYTPTNLGAALGAFRQYAKLVLSRPGREAELSEHVGHMTRLVKLVVNGWDDRNRDNKVQHPSECLRASLQMGERGLTGEPGTVSGDYDHDCVPDVSVAQLPANLASEMVIKR